MNIEKETNPLRLLARLIGGCVGHAIKAVIYGSVIGVIVYVAIKAAK